jgi:hypothetical protein
MAISSPPLLERGYGGVLRHVSVSARSEEMGSIACQARFTKSVTHFLILGLRFCLIKTRCNLGLLNRKRDSSVVRRLRQLNYLIIHTILQSYHSRGCRPYMRILRPCPHRCQIDYCDNYHSVSCGFLSNLYVPHPTLDPRIA